MNGQQSVMAPLDIQYADFAVWQREWLQGDVLQTQSSYWREQLTDIPAVHTLPLDYPRPKNKQFEGGIVSGRLPRDGG